MMLPQLPQNRMSQASVKRTSNDCPHGRALKSSMSLLTAAALGSLLCMLASDIHAQMQIPNPLLQPQKTRTSADVSPAPPAASENLPPMRPVPLDGFGNTRNAVNESGDDSLKDLRDRFTGFHVSAIMGNQAILRRNSGGGLGQGLAPAAASGTVNQVGMSAPIAGAGGRSQAFLLVHNEPVDFVGESIRLVPHISANRVLIYYIRGSAKPEDKPARNPVVFVGEVESSESMQAFAPVLEKPDSAYRQSINVQSKALSTQSSSSSNGQTPGSQPLVPSF